MTGKETLRRYILVIIGSFFMGMGVALTKCAGLGLSTISSVPYVLSLKFSFITVGTWLSVWNIIMILVQLLILKKEFKLIQVLQIPVSVIFGLFTDLGVFMFSFIPVPLYILKMVESALGVIVLGFGISFTVMADKVMNPGEALVKVIADKLNINFGKMKIMFDVFCVLFASILSLIFFKNISGVGVGTIIAVFLTGPSANFFIKHFRYIIIPENTARK